jgi:hypothetical protein
MNINIGKGVLHNVAHITTNRIENYWVFGPCLALNPLKEGFKFPKNKND